MNLDPHAVPTAPAYLTAGARQVWLELAPAVAERGRLTPLYAIAFGLLCSTVAQVRAMAADLDAQGWILTGPRGGRYRHPLASAYTRHLDLCRKLCQDFGLTPPSDLRLARHEPRLRALRVVK